MEVRVLSDVYDVFGWDREDRSSIYTKTLENIENRLKSRLPENDEVELTALQRLALSHREFCDDWSDSDRVPKHLIVQGATSSGKTLLSELNILDVVSRRLQAIVLVPLKAMVHERTRQFIDDLEGQGLRVYGSSSDYMDNDERLINGEYDVAIIVYEKYYAMLSQNGGAILDACRLLVVDELSMLSKEERGPKLEMALEITRIKNPQTRIMCLATSDCKTDKIREWLGKDTIQINSPLRPVGLDEYILTENGTGKHRYIPSEKEFDSIDVNAQKLRESVISEDVQLEIPGYNEELRDREKREKFLLAVIRKIYQKNPNAKTLIFAATKADTERYADFLSKQASDIFGPVTEDEEFRQTMADIETCDRDDDRDHIKTLMQRGLSYHNSGVSTNLREIIESAFQRNSSPVKAVVATETLTVGVNMPFDAMIMMDCRVPKRKGDKVELTSQEYRNYIGRAGRLGQSNTTGQTYLYVRKKELTTFWRSFDEEPVEIASALKDAKETERAPYFLGLLAVSTRGDAFDIRNLTELYDRSLSRIFDSKQVDIDKIQNELYENYLVDIVKKKKKGRGNLPGYHPEEPSLLQLKVSAFGKDMAPYALSMETCESIYSYFLHGSENGGMPAGITEKMIDSDYCLLEILYHVCQHPEIARSSNLMMPQNVGLNASRLYTATATVKKKLNQMFSEKDDRGNYKHQLWKDCENTNELRAVAMGTNTVDQTEKLQAAMRAILIYYWTQGKLTSEIKKETGFNTFLKIISGDLERLAEVISFHLDAIYRSLVTAAAGSRMVLADSQALAAFYALQTRVKYGMGRDLVVLANKHVHGLDRSRLLEFGRLCAEMGKTPLELLMTLPDRVIVKYMTLGQRNLLCQRNNARYRHANQFDILLKAIESDIGSDFSPELSANLQRIFEWGTEGNDADALLTAFQNLLSHRKNKRKIFGDFSQVDRRGTDPYLVWTGKCRTNRDGESVEDDILLGVLTGDPGESAAVREFLKREAGSGMARARILIIPNDGGKLLEKQGWNPGDVDVVMTNSIFAELLVNAIARRGSCDRALLSILTDLKGVFGVSIEKNRPSDLLQNYIVKEKDQGVRPRFRLLYSGSIDDTIRFDSAKLINTLTNTEDLSNYEVLPWGYALECALETKDYNDFTDCPTIICLSSENVICSRSLTKFLYKMGQQNYSNCFVLLESEQAHEQWIRAAEKADPYGEKWWEKNNQIPGRITPDVKTAVSAIRDIVGNFEKDGFLIGISYSHYEDVNVSEEQYRNANCSRECCDSDIEKLERVAEALREEYGEHRVMFDQFKPAAGQFRKPEAKKKSMDGYRQCRFFLVLSNWWTYHNEICKEEIQVMKERYQEGKASYLYLTTRSQASMDPGGDEYTWDINDIDGILEEIRNSLREQK